MAKQTADSFKVPATAAAGTSPDDVQALLAMMRNRASPGYQQSAPSMPGVSASSQPTSALVDAFMRSMPPSQK